MYRGSRLAASFLLVLTGLAATATGLFVVPQADGGGPLLTTLAIGFAVLHLAALVGIVWGRDWGRTSAVLVAEIGGGLAILAAVALATGARPFGSSSGTGIGFVAWAAF